MGFRVVTWIITVIIGAVRALCENAPLHPCTRSPRPDTGAKPNPIPPVPHHASTPFQDWLPPASWAQIKAFPAVRWRYEVPGLPAMRYAGSALEGTCQVSGLTETCFDGSTFVEGKDDLISPVPSPSAQVSHPVPCGNGHGRRFSMLCDSVVARRRRLFYRFGWFCGKMTVFLAFLGGQTVLLHRHLFVIPKAIPANVLTPTNFHCVP